jgi:hypothetical protein
MNLALNTFGITRAHSPQTILCARLEKCHFRAHMFLLVLFVVINAKEDMFCVWRKPCADLLGHIFAQQAERSYPGTSVHIVASSDNNVMQCPESINHIACFFENACTRILGYESNFLPLKADSKYVHPNRMIEGFGTYNGHREQVYLPYNDKLIQPFHVELFMRMFSMLRVVYWTGIPVSRPEVLSEPTIVYQVGGGKPRMLFTIRMRKGMGFDLAALQEKLSDQLIEVKVMEDSEVSFNVLKVRTLNVLTEQSIDINSYGGQQVMFALIDLTGWGRRGSRLAIIWDCLFVVSDSKSVL